MNYIYKFGFVGIVLLSGCATNIAPNNPVQVAKSPSPMTALAPVHSGAVAKRLNDCIVNSNQGADALLVDSQIIAVTRGNPHAKALFSSPDKLTDQQAKALANYLLEANSCRPIALEGLSPEMTSMYQEFFKKIDGVYADLISKKITIGVANQERQLLIQDAHMKRLAIQSKKNQCDRFMARYKFTCGSCKFECISSIGKEVGLHTSRVAMVCKSCSTIDAYTVAHPGRINTEISMPPICTSCHSSKNLSEWDGLTCPHCQMKMRAIGSDVDLDKSRFKYW